MRLCCKHWAEGWGQRGRLGRKEERFGGLRGEVCLGGWGSIPSATPSETGTGRGQRQAEVSRGCGTVTAVTQGALDLVSSVSLGKSRTSGVRARGSALFSQEENCPLSRRLSLGDTS